MTKQVRQIGYHTTGPGRRGFAIFEDGSTQFDNEPNKQYALEAEVEALKAQRDALVKACEDIHKALSDNDDMPTTVEWVRDLVELTLGRKP